MPKKITTYHANLVNGCFEDRKTVRVEDASSAYEAFKLGDKQGEGFGSSWWTLSVKRYTLKELAEIQPPLFEKN